MCLVFSVVRSLLSVYGSSSAECATAPIGCFGIAPDAGGCDVIFFDFTEDGQLIPDGGRGDGEGEEKNLLMRRIDRRSREKYEERKGVGWEQVNLGQRVNERKLTFKENLLKIEENDQKGRFSRVSAPKYVHAK